MKVLKTVLHILKKKEKLNGEKATLEDVISENFPTVMKGKLSGAKKSQQITSKTHLHKTPRSCNIIVTFLKANNKLKILKTQKTYLFMTHYQQESLL